MQRNHQKLIEESPVGRRDRRGSAADRRAGRARAPQAIGYPTPAPWSSCSTRTGSFYFMEMNTRIQVEHPVTEEVTGLDLVKEQIRVAAGEPLSLDAGGGRVLRGHAIECRINAEDPEHDFRPTPGHDHLLVQARRPRRARGQPRLQRLRGPAVLRLDDRQADRLRQGPRRGAAAHGDRARGDDHRGHQATIPFHLWRCGTRASVPATSTRASSRPGSRSGPRRRPAAPAPSGAPVGGHRAAGRALRLRLDPVPLRRDPARGSRRPGRRPRRWRSRPTRR